MKHIVFFSSGKASFVTALLVAKRYGLENLFLVFADTGIEDQDNYRFLIESVDYIGAKFAWIRDGRTPWDIFFEKKFINHRVSDCSIELKIKPCEKWIKECEFDPTDTILYFGIGLEEVDRMNAIARNWYPYKVDTPLTWGDGQDNRTINKMVEATEIKQPRLYDLGFAHANCGGFCPKAGKKHYKNLLEKLPDVYAYHEDLEQKFRSIPGRENVGILRTTIKGILYPTSLKQFRESLQQNSTENLDQEILGGCGCFID